MPPENPQAIANAIFDFYENTDKSLMGKKIEDEAYRFSWDKLIDTIDADLRLSLVIEGYNGIVVTLGRNVSSWLTRSLLIDSENISEFITTTSPKHANKKLVYLMISKIMIEDGYITDWANYGTTKDNWIKKLPLNGTMIPFNPYLQRIYDNAIVYLLYEL